MQMIKGGLCAPNGFKATGICCGIRPAHLEKNDIMMLFSEKECTAAGLFTRNQVKAAPVLLDIETLKAGKAQAVIANSGNANACAQDADENARAMQKAAADALGVDKNLVVVSSTGVIGQRLNIEAVKDAAPKLASALEHSENGSEQAALAIMTTDTVKKELACEVELAGKKVSIGAIAKGSGMIHPNMGTMLCFITTDCSISSEMLRSALKEVCDLTFNRITVDGDTSTNDSLVILANGMAGNDEICKINDDYIVFVEALKQICTEMARQMAADGEGAKHLITCNVKGTETDKEAEIIAKSVVGSTLLKAAIFGCDANWGRVLCAMGYSGVSFNPEKVDVEFASKAGSIDICKNGRGLDFDEDKAKLILKEKEVIINITTGIGAGNATCWGCDITYDYIQINGDYRT